MASNSSSSLNTRIFAPYVILSQNTSRLLIKISTGQGYSIVSGITLGDVIRFDPTFSSGGLTGQYVKSQANTDANAEVLGVVESIENNSYTVVTHGSILYPNNRLVGLCGANGGLDVLFLSPGISGGLTGTAEVGSVASIVKPVIQIAPHGFYYNAVVVNYLGFKVGGSAGGQQALLGSNENGRSVGEIIWASEDAVLEENWINLSEDVLLEKDNYPELFSIYKTDNGPWQEQLTFSSTPNVYLQNKNTYQINDSGFKVNFGTVTEINNIEKSIIITRTTPNTTTVSLDKQYVNNVVNGAITDLNFVSKKVYKFTIPAVKSDINPKQNDVVLVPYINSRAKPFILNFSTNPVFDNLTIGQTLSVGSITNVENKILAMQYQIDQLNSRTT